MNKPTIILLADYGTGDAAFTEVSLRLLNLIPDATVLPQSVPAFNTLNTGFWLAQFALTPDIKNTYIFSNTAPRTKVSSAQKNNKGEALMYAKLKNGFEIMAVGSGFTFSFIKDHIDEFNQVEVTNEGSQFRSRDKYPQVVSRMISGDMSFLGEKHSTDIIPDYPKNTVGAIDGYGNVKTTIRRSEVDYKPGQELSVTLNNVTRNAVFTDGSFNIETGKIAFAPGSTGHDDKFMEIFLRGGNTAKEFNGAKSEQEVIIKSL